MCLQFRQSSCQHKTSSLNYKLGLESPQLYIESKLRWNITSPRIVAGDNKGNLLKFRCATRSLESIRQKRIFASYQNWYYHTRQRAGWETYQLELSIAPEKALAHLLNSQTLYNMQSQKGWATMDRTCPAFWNPDIYNLRSRLCLFGTSLSRTWDTCLGLPAYRSSFLWPWDSASLSWSGISYNRLALTYLPFFKYS